MSNAAALSMNYSAADTLDRRVRQRPSLELVPADPRLGAPSADQGQTPNHVFEAARAFVREWNNLDAQEWPKPCRAAFDELAGSSPSRLAVWMVSRRLSPPHVSYAAEALGATAWELAPLVLLGMIRHPEPIVREGAVYGLQHHLDDAVRTVLRLCAKSDASPGVRSAAAEVLEE